MHRAAVAAAAAHGWDTPSYSTVRDIVAALDVPLVTLAQQGTKAYQQAYDLLYRCVAAAPNEMWQADHTQLDLLVLDPASRPGRGWL